MAYSRARALHAWHGLTAFAVVARDYIERNRRLRTHIYVQQATGGGASVQRWCKCVLQVLHLLMQVHLLQQVQVQMVVLL
jgi:hypothetical protein